MIFNFEREAFFNPFNLLFLTGTLVLSVFPILPFEVLLTTSLGLELAYLGVVPNMSRFRNYIYDKKLNKGTTKQRLMWALKLIQDPNLLVQAEKILLVKQQILQNITQQSPLNTVSIEHTQEKLDELLLNYISLLRTKQHYDSFVYLKDSQSFQDRINQSISSIENELKTLNKKELIQIKQQRINILKKRLDRLEHIHNRKDLCQAQIENIEETLQYIYEQSINTPNIDHTYYQLDMLIQETDEHSYFNNTHFNEMDIKSIFSDNKHLQHLDKELDIAKKTKAPLSNKTSL